MDYDGRLLSVQLVPRGGSAVAPSIPGRVGFLFSGWQGTYSNVSSDVSVTAEYTEIPAETYTVTFCDDDETVLKQVPGVVYGGYAEPPSAPTKVGAAFLGWNGQYAGVTEDATVRAVYDDSRNVFQISSGVGSV